MPLLKPTHNKYALDQNLIGRLLIMIYWQVISERLQDFIVDYYED